MIFSGNMFSTNTASVLDERLFPRPEEFLPERWTTQPDLVKDPSVFVPFSTGRLSHTLSLISGADTVDQVHILASGSNIF
jgi:hypothetical protein